MSKFQKQFQIKMTSTTDQDMEAWLLATTNLETVERFKRIREIHNNSVQEAIACGDCMIDNQASVANIHWLSQEVHESYINSWPAEEHKFYMQVWDLFLASQ
jgi:hypothetical protein